MHDGSGLGWGYRAVANAIYPLIADECMYVVTKLKEMPKLHRAVWRGDLIKVKSIGNGIRKTVLNTRDKEHRLVAY